MPLLEVQLQVQHAKMSCWQHHTQRMHTLVSRLRVDDAAQTTEWRGCVQVLHVAAIRRQLEVMECLLSLGLKPNPKSARGWTPLDEAVCLKDRAMVRPALLWLHRTPASACTLELSSLALTSTNRCKPGQALEGGDAMLVSGLRHAKAITM